MKEADSLHKLCYEHLKCLQESVGPSGTLVVPTYSSHLVAKRMEKITHTIQEQHHLKSAISQTM